MEFLKREKESLLLEYRIEEGLEVYVDRFFSEAEKRGVFIEKENLIFEFKKNDG